MIEDEIGESNQTESTAVNETQPTTNPKDTPDLNDILSTINENNTLLKQIQNTIHDRLEYDDIKERQYSKLYEVMKKQEDSSEILDRTIRPLLIDLLFLYDNIKNLESKNIEHSITDIDMLIEIKTIKEELLEILYRQDVLPLKEDISDFFDSKNHNATKIENTDNKDDDWKVVGILRDGFRWREKVLRPQNIVIKRFTENI